MRNTLLPILSVVCLLAGCTTLGKVAPPPEPEPGKAVLVFYAQQGGPQNIDKLEVDGKFIHRFSPGYFFTYQVTPGEHQLKNGFGLRWEEKMIRVEAGKTYYICSEVKNNFVMVTKHLVFVDPMEGREAVKKMRRWEN